MSQGRWFGMSAVVVSVALVVPVSEAVAQDGEKKKPEARQEHEREHRGGQEGREHREGGEGRPHGGGGDHPELTAEARRKVVRAFANEVQKHRSRAARMKRLRVLAEEKGDTERLKELKRLYDEESSRFQGVLARIEEKLGAEGFQAARQKVQSASEQRREHREGTGEPGSHRAGREHGEAGSREGREHRPPQDAHQGKGGAEPEKIDPRDRRGEAARTHEKDEARRHDGKSEEMKGSDYTPEQRERYRKDQELRREMQKKHQQQKGNKEHGAGEKGTHETPQRESGDGKGDQKGGD